MQHYATNSPQAAARIVALALLSDGHLCKEEIDALDRVAAHEQLGLSPAEMHQVLHRLGQDLLEAAQHRWGGAGMLDAEVLDSVLDEVRDPALRQRIINLIVAVVDADTHVADGESAVLLAAWRRWGDSLGGLEAPGTQKRGSVASGADERRPAVN
jgi:uncharacterized tellurite resistance protein B-like protein